MEDARERLLDDEGCFSNDDRSSRSSEDAEHRREQGDHDHGTSQRRDEPRDISRAETELQDYASETETVRSIQGSAKKRFVAVLCIALAIAIWVTELEVTHDVIGHGPGQYDNAYALVWMSHNVSLFLGFGLGAVFACFAEVPDGAESAWDMLLRPQRGMLTSTLLLSIVVNLCAWAWFVSLPLTDPMVNTVIYQSCCVWCFLISVVVLNERVTCIKVTSTLCTFFGVATISSFPCVSGPQPGPGPDPDATEHLYGDLLCICSAVLYALYEVLFKYYSEAPPSTCLEDDIDEESSAAVVPEPAPVDVHRHAEGGALHLAATSTVFVGWLGFWNFFLLWFPIAALHYTGVTEFDVPETEVRPILWLDAALEGTYCVCLAVAISFSSPLFVTIGTVLAIPVSAMVDALFNGISCPAASGVGTGLVVAGFLGINIATLLDGRSDVPSWL